MEVKNPPIAVTFQIRPVSTSMIMGERVTLHPCSVFPCRPGEVRLSLERLVLSEPSVESNMGLAGGPPAMQLTGPKTKKQISIYTVPTSSQQNGIDRPDRPTFRFHCSIYGGIVRGPGRL